MKQCKGFALFELLVVVAIIVLLSTVSIPSFHTVMAKARDQTLRVELLSAIYLSRSEAALRGTTMTLCGSNDRVSCARDGWPTGQLVFVDKKQTGEVADKKDIAYELNGAKHGGILHWRSALNRPYLQILPSGLTHGENGTFWLCHPDEKTPRWAIVVSQSGRPRSVTSGAELEELSC